MYESFKELNMEDKEAFSPILDSIIAAFKARYGDSYFIGDYSDVDENENIKTPAIFIELTNFENAENPVRELFRAKCTFRAYICESYRGKAKRRVRDTALDVAKFINLNTWDNRQIFTEAKFTYALEDDFNEKITSCEIWYDEWEQEVYLDNLA